MYRRDILAMHEQKRLFVVPCDSLKRAGRRSRRVDTGNIRLGQTSAIFLYLFQYWRVFILWGSIEDCSTRSRTIGFWKRISEVVANGEETVKGSRYLDVVQVLWNRKFSLTFPRHLFLSQTALCIEDAVLRLDALVELELQIPCRAFCFEFSEPSLASSRPWMAGSFCPRWNPHGKDSKEMSTEFSANLPLHIRPVTSHGCSIWYFRSDTWLALAPQHQHQSHEWSVCILQLCLFYIQYMISPYMSFLCCPRMQCRCPMLNSICF